jgi:hypothetical protein
LATAKKARKRGHEICCVFTESSKSAWLLAICAEALLKSRVSRQKKVSVCKGYGAARDAHMAGMYAIGQCVGLAAGC